MEHQDSRPCRVTATHRLLWCEALANINGLIDGTFVDRFQKHGELRCTYRVRAKTGEMRLVHIPCLSLRLSVHRRTVSTCSTRDCFQDSIERTFFFPAVPNPPHSSSRFTSPAPLAPRSIGSMAGAGSGSGRGSGSALPFFPFYTDRPLIRNNQRPSSRGPNAAESTYLFFPCGSETTPIV